MVQSGAWWSLIVPAPPLISGRSCVVRGGAPYIGMDGWSRRHGGSGGDGGTCLEVEDEWGCGGNRVGEV